MTTNAEVTWAQEEEEDSHRQRVCVTWQLHGALSEREFNENPTETSIRPTSAGWSAQINGQRLYRDSVIRHAVLVAGPTEGWPG